MGIKAYPNSEFIFFYKIYKNLNKSLPQISGQAKFHWNPFFKLHVSMYVNKIF